MPTPDPLAVQGLQGPASPAPTIPVDPPDDVNEALRLMLETVVELADGFLSRLPIIGLALLLFVVGVLVVGRLARLTAGAMTRTQADRAVTGLLARLLRVVLISVVALLALSVAGVDVGAALAGLGIAGLALAFALQNILENFVSGMLLLIRKPFRVGDQIRTGDFEGTVEDVDFRVTKLVDYDGELVLIPNADVFRNPLINLTRRGSRRTRVVVGVDYRDDHDRAREVIRAAVTGIEGVLDAPAPEILLCELGDSSVNFEILYWTAPDIGSVRRTQDRVLSAAKSGLEAAGMTIPWPIRTLAFDEAVRVTRDDASAGGRG